MSEKVTVKVERSVLHLPAIALRGLVVFPNNLLHFEVGREKSIAAVEWAVSNNSDVFLVAQKEMKVEDPKAADLYTYGVVAEVKQVMRVSDDLVRILVEGKYRAKLSEMEDDGSFLLATVRPAPVKMAKPEELPEADVLVRNVKKSFDDLLALNPHIGKDVVFAITTSTDAAFLSEYIPANLLFRFEDKQAILDEGTLMGRLHLLIEKMHRERRMLEIDKEIAQKVDEAMDKNQRDYYLHEQLHMISEELGEDDHDRVKFLPPPRPRSTAGRSRPSIWTRTGKRSFSKRWTASPKCRAAIRKARSSAPIWTPASTCPGIPSPRTIWTSPRPSACWTETTTA